MHQQSCGRTPGVDGLPVKFYKAFWRVLARDFYESYKAVSVLLSLSYQSISDYTILYKRSANRLEGAFDALMQEGQSHCITG